MLRNGPKCKSILEKDKQAGFTLIEILLSLLLLYLLAGLLLNALVLADRHIASSGRQTLACAYAVSLLEEMKVHPERYIISGSHHSFFSDQVAFAVDPPPGVTARIETAPLDDAAWIYRVEVQLCGEQGGRPWQESLLGFVRLEPEEC